MLTVLGSVRNTPQPLVQSTTMLHLDNGVASAQSFVSPQVVLGSGPDSGVEVCTASSSRGHSMEPLLCIAKSKRDGKGAVANAYRVYEAHFLGKRGIEADTLLSRGLRT